jgi:hypothetical protein
VEIRRYGLAFRAHIGLTANDWAINLAILFKIEKKPDDTASWQQDKHPDCPQIATRPVTEECKHHVLSRLFEQAAWV